MAGPPYLAGRVVQGHELLRVSIQLDEEEKEKLAACVKSALGLEGGRVVLAEGQEPTVRLEMMVPSWDPARKRGRVH